MKYKLEKDSNHGYMVIIQKQKTNQGGKVKKRGNKGYNNDPRRKHD